MYCLFWHKHRKHTHSADLAVKAHVMVVDVHVCSYQSSLDTGLNIPFTIYL